jgi:hypothetical protein
MQTILDILKMAGGWHHGLYLKIENPLYPELVIDAMDESGPFGLPALCVAQYGNAIANPEMHFELGFAGGPHLNPFYYRNDLSGVEQWSRLITEDHYAHDNELHQQHEELAKLWDENLRQQGFPQAFVRQRQLA